jgi:hypothetical protein
MLNQKKEKPKKKQKKIKKTKKKKKPKKTKKKEKTKKRKICTYCIFSFDEVSYILVLQSKLNINHCIFFFQ